MFEELEIELELHKLIDEKSAENIRLETDKEK